MREPPRHHLTLLLALALVLAMTTVTAAQTPDPAPTTAKERAVHAVNLTAKLRIKPQGSAFVGAGAASGTPFGTGRARLRSTIKSRSPLRTSSTLTVVTTKGKAVFKGTGRYAGSTFKVTMKASSGAGRYRGIEGSNLAVTVVSRNGIDLLRMRGNVRFRAAVTQPTP